MPDLPFVILKPGREHAASRGHCWIFSGAVQRAPKGVEEGALVEVRSERGDFVGVGHFGTKSIAVRLLSRLPGQSLEQIFKQSFSEALGLRKSLGLLDNNSTNCFRLIHAEGDGLPGLVIDIYAKTAVLQIHSEGMKAALPLIKETLLSLEELQLEAIYCRLADEEEANAERGAERGEYIHGTPSAGPICEQGLWFEGDWEKGQKTGFFLDQRENRHLLERYAKGRRVLNTFCYSGGFSLYALRGGAREVVSIDSSQRALELLEHNLETNGLNSNHIQKRADCFTIWSDLEGSFDLIVLDPPALVKHKAALQRGMKGYENLNLHALAHLPAGGLLFTFSCSPFVDSHIFREMLERAVLKSGKKAKILHLLSQAPCHPINLQHPESEYLKGAVLEITPRS